MRANLEVKPETHSRRERESVCFRSESNVEGSEAASVLSICALCITLWKRNVECYSSRDQEIGIIPQPMFEVHVWDFKADTFYELCTEKTHRAAVNPDDDHEQSIEMVRTCDENGG